MSTKQTNATKTLRRAGDSVALILFDHLEVDNYVQNPRPALAGAVRLRLSTASSFRESTHRSRVGDLEAFLFLVGADSR